jgi:hypothetical protein
MMYGHFRREVFWMWLIPGAILVVGLVSAILGIRSIRWERADAERRVARVLQLCEEITLPNSMARPPGFDINAHLAALRTERSQLVGSLRNPVGAQAAQSHRGPEQDELRRHCLEQLMAELPSS